MDKKYKALLEFVTQTLILFAISILILIILAYLFGDMAQNTSPLYQMGSRGLASSTMLEFLFSSAIITALKNVFFSQLIFKKLMTLWRTVLMLFSILIASIIFIIIFEWFPLNYAMGWAGFLICFGGSCLVISVFLIIKTKIESRRYEALLDDYKKKYQLDSDE